MIIQFGLVFLSVTLCATRTSEEWKTRVIYQLLTDRFGHTGSNPTSSCTDLRGYCGGTFKGIEQRLDYIQGLGANAIWISPIVENAPGGYHGYWAKNIYKVNPMFGTEADLISLVTECHRRDIWIMFDVIANHVGRTPGCQDRSCPTEKLTNFRDFVPFNQPNHYHELCFIDNFFNQTEVELCRLGILPDLNQTVPYVRGTLLEWIANLTRKYNVDGLRIDTLCEVEKPFWHEFQAAAGVFCLGEANNGRGRTAYHAAYQGEAVESVLNLPMYWALRGVFNEGQPMTSLLDSIKLQRTLFQDTTILGLFADNHDFQRFLNLTNDEALLRNSLTYVFFGQGIPIVYYGTEQMFSGGNDPNNRESLWPHENPTSDMYQFIWKLAETRKAMTSDLSPLNQKEVYTDADAMVFTRGPHQEMLVVVTNAGKSKRSVVKTVTDLNTIPDGTVFSNILDSADKVIVKSGTVNITLVDGDPKIYQQNTKTLVVCLPNQACSVGAALVTNSLASIIVPIGITLGRHVFP